MEICSFFDKFYLKGDTKWNKCCYIPPNISHMEGKSFVQHSGFSHKVTQLHVIFDVTENAILNRRGKSAGKFCYYKKNMTSPINQFLLDETKKLRKFGNVNSMTPVRRVTEFWFGAWRKLDGLEVNAFVMAELGRRTKVRKSVSEGTKTLRKAKKIPEVARHLLFVLHGAV